MVERDVRSATSVSELLALPLSGMSAALFAALSALRRKRVFHPVGEAFAATVELWAPPEFHLPNGTHHALVRFSRGAGLPEPLPDILGLAIKVLGTPDVPEQDILLASSGGPPGVRNTLVPSRSFLRCTYSSVLPYRPHGTRVVLGARATAGLSTAEGDLGDLEAIAGSGHLSFEILVAELTGGWEQIGTLLIGDRCTQETSRALRFNPWHSHPEFHPAGALNRLRRSAYPASQDARPG